MNLAAVAATTWSSTHSQEMDGGLNDRTNSYSEVVSAFCLLQQQLHEATQHADDYEAWFWVSQMRHKTQLVVQRQRDASVDIALVLQLAQLVSMMEVSGGVCPPSLEHIPPEFARVCLISGHWYHAEQRLFSAANITTIGVQLGDTALIGVPPAWMQEGI